MLGRIEVEGGTTDQYRTFYSCLYRSTLFPRKFYEIDKNGNILHYSPYNGEVLPGYMYTDTGFWDTFRSLFPRSIWSIRRSMPKFRPGWQTLTARADFCPNGLRPDTVGAWSETTRRRSFRMPS